MADRDAILRLPARTFFDGCLPNEQRQLYSIIQLLCEDPSPDGVLKLHLSQHPDEPLLYRDEQFFVVYRELNDWTLAVWQIGYNTDDTFIAGRPD